MILVKPKNIQLFDKPALKTINSQRSLCENEIISELEKAKETEAQKTGQRTALDFFVNQQKANQSRPQTIESRKTQKPLDFLLETRDINSPEQKSRNQVLARKTFTNLKRYDTNQLISLTQKRLQTIRNQDTVKHEKKDYFNNLDSKQYSKMALPYVNRGYRSNKVKIIKVLKESPPPERVEAKPSPNEYLNDRRIAELKEKVFSKVLVKSTTKDSLVPGKYSRLRIV